MCLLKGGHRKQPYSLNINIRNAVATDVPLQDLVPTFVGIKVGGYKVCLNKAFVGRTFPKSFEVLFSIGLHLETESLP
jgi:hypothetical protein